MSRCLACVVNERPAPSRSAPLLMGLAIGLRAPATKQAEILGNFCFVHKRAFDTLAANTEAIVNGVEAFIKPER